MSGIALSLFGGNGGSATIALYPTYVYAFNSGAFATAAYRLGSDGTIYESINGGAYTAVLVWCTPGSLAGNYECYATLTGGTLNSGTTGSWLSLSSNQTFSARAAPGSTVSAYLTIVIRHVGDTAILASSSVTLDAESA